jgi:hypothetical protein
MSSIVSHFVSGAPNNRPTELEPGQIAYNFAARLMFFGDGTNNATDITGNSTPTPTAGKGYVTERMGSGEVYVAATANLGGTQALTNTAINTAIGTVGAKGDIAIIQGGSAEGGWIVEPSGDWRQLSGATPRLTDVFVFPTVAAFNADAAAKDEGDVIVIQNSTSLNTLTAVGTIPASLTQGADYPVSLIFDGAAWQVLGNPVDRTFAAGDGITESTAGTTTTFAANFAASGVGNNGTATTVARGDHTHQMNDLSDVDIAALTTVPAANQVGVLIFNSATNRVVRTEVLAAGSY